MFGCNLPLITVTIKVDTSLYSSSPFNRQLAVATVTKVLNKDRGVRNFVMVDDCYGGRTNVVEFEVFGRVNPRRLVKKLADQGIIASFYSGGPRRYYDYYPNYEYPCEPHPYPYQYGDGHGPYGYDCSFGGYGSGSRGYQDDCYHYCPGVGY